MDVHLAQPLSFSNDMSNDQLAEWLRNHPSLIGIDYEEDISKLRGTLHDNVLIHFFKKTVCLYCNNKSSWLLRLDARINGHIFLSLNESRLERFRVSFGFQFAIMNIIEDIMVCSWEDASIVHWFGGQLVCICAQEKSQQPPKRERLTSGSSRTQYIYGESKILVGRRVPSGITLD